MNDKLLQDEDKSENTIRNRGPLENDKIDNGYFYDLNMWRESTIDVLKKAEKTLKYILENEKEACKISIPEVATISIREVNERNVISKGSCFIISLFGRGYCIMDKPGFYKIYSSRGKPKKGFTPVAAHRFTDAMDTDKRPLKKFLFLKHGRDIKECAKNKRILDQFDFVALCDFGREFVYVT